MNIKSKQGSSIPQTTALAPGTVTDAETLKEFQHNSHSILRLAKEQRNGGEEKYLILVKEVKQFVSRYKRGINPNRIVSAVCDGADALISLNTLQSYRWASICCLQPMLDEIQASGSREPNHRQFPRELIRAFLTYAECKRQVAQLSDPLIREKCTLEKQLVDSLSCVKSAQELLLRLETKEREQRYWQLLNSSIMCYSICEPLVTLGLAKVVPLYVSRTIVAVESVLSLKTAKYLPWRAKLYTLLINAYLCIAQQNESENVGLDESQAKRHVNNAVKIATRLGSQCDELELIEREELPVPPKTLETINTVRSQSRALLQQINMLQMPNEKLETREATNEVEPSNDGSEMESEKEEKEPVVENLSTTTPILETYEVIARKAKTIIFGTANTTQGNTQLCQHIETFVQMMNSNEQDCPISCVLDICDCCLLSKNLSHVPALCTYVLQEAQTGLEGGTEHFSRLSRDQLLQLLRVMYSMYVLESGDESALMVPGTEETLVDPQAGSQYLNALARVEGRDIRVAHLDNFAHQVLRCTESDFRIIMFERPDLFAGIAVTLWKPYGSAVLESIGAQETVAAMEIPESLLSIALQVLQAVDAVAQAVDLEDSLIRAQVCLRLGYLWSAGRGDSIRAIQVLRHGCSFLRNELALSLSYPGGCDPEHVSVYSLSALPAFAKAVQNQRKLGTAALGPQETVPETGRWTLRCGRGNTTSELQALLADMTVMLFRVEIMRAVELDAETKRRKQRTKRGTSSSETGKGGRKPGKTHQKNRNEEEHLSGALTRLSRRCNRNHHEAGLFHSTCANLARAPAEKVGHLSDALTCFFRAGDKEFRLWSAHQKILQTLEGLRDGDWKRPELSHNDVVAAPVCISRSSTSICLGVLPFNVKSQHEDHLVFVPKYLVLYGKDSKSGNSISDTNTLLNGTGLLTPMEMDGMTTFHVTNLVPNRTYVFAVAAFDELGQKIGSISKVSIPIEAVSIVPIVKGLADVCTAAFSRVSDLPVETCKDPNENAKHISPEEEKEQQMSAKNNPEDVECVRLGKLAFSLLFRYFVKENEVNDRPFTDPLHYYSLRNEIVGNTPPSVLQAFVRSLFSSTEKAVAVATIPYSGFRAESETEMAPRQSLKESQARTCRIVQKLLIAGEIATVLGDCDAVLEAATLAFDLVLHLFECDNIGPLVLPTLITIHHMLFLIPKSSWTVEVTGLYARVCFQITKVSDEVKERQLLRRIFMEQLGKEQGGVNPFIGGTSFRVPTPVLDFSNPHVPEEQRSIWMLLSGRREFIQDGLSIVHQASLSTELAPIQAQKVVDDEGTVEQVTTRATDEELWEQVNKALSSNLPEVAWKALDSDTAENHPLYLHMICLVCQKAAEMGMPQAVSWAGDIQELFHDLKCTKNITQGDDFGSEGKEHEVETEEGLVTASNDEVNGGAAPDVKNQEDSTNVPDSSDAVQDTEQKDEPTEANCEDPNGAECTSEDRKEPIVQNQKQILDSFQAETDTFLDPLAKLVLHEELSESKDPFGSIMAQQCYPFFDEEVPIASADAYELHGRLVELSSSENLAMQEQLGSLAELELIRAKATYKNCEQAYATIPLGNHKLSSLDSGPLIDSTLFLQIMDRDSQNLSTETQHDEFRAVTTHIPATLHLCGRAATRAYWARNWNQVQLAGKLAWNAVLMGWSSPFDVSETAICQSVLNPRLRKQILQAKGDARMLKFMSKQQQDEPEESKVSDAEQEASPEMVPRIRLDDSPRSGAEEEKGPVSIDWRPLWRIAFSLIEMLEEVVIISGGTGRASPFYAAVEQLTAKGRSDGQPWPEAPDQYPAASVGQRSDNALDREEVLGYFREHRICTLWVFHLVHFLAQSLIHLRRFRLTLVLSDRFDAATCGEYAMQLLPLMIRAQGELVQRACADREAAQLAMERYEADWKEAHKKKKRRHVKKSKASLAHNISPQVVHAHNQAMDRHRAHVARVQAVEDMLRCSLHALERRQSDLERDENTSVMALRLARQNVDEALAGVNASSGNKSARSTRSARSVLTQSHANNPGLRVPGGLSGYSKLVVSLQQKQERHLLIQGYADLGDLQFASGSRGGVAAAGQSWSCAIDAVFSQVDTLRHWRAVLVQTAEEWRLQRGEPAPAPGAEDRVGPAALEKALARKVETVASAGTRLSDLLNAESTLMSGTYPADALYSKFGMYECIMGAVAAVRVARSLYQKVLTQHENCLVLASFLVQGAMSGSMHVPGRLHEFATFSTRVPFPTLQLLCDQKRIPPMLLVESLRYLVAGLLSSASVTVVLRALPVVVLYEYVASSLLLNASHTANARVLRAKLLTRAGMLQEATACVADLLRGVGIPGIQSKATTGAKEQADNTETNGDDAQDSTIPADDADREEGDVEDDTHSTGKENQDLGALAQFDNALPPDCEHNISVIEWLLDLNGTRPCVEADGILGVGGVKKLQSIRISIALHALELWRDGQSFMSSDVGEMSRASVRHWERLLNRTSAAIKILMKAPRLKQEQDAGEGTTDTPVDTELQDKADEEEESTSDQEAEDSQIAMENETKQQTVQWIPNPILRLEQSDYVRRHQRLRGTAAQQVCSLAVDSLKEFEPLDSYHFRAAESNETQQSVASWWDHDGAATPVIGVCGILELRLEIARLLLEQRNVEDALSQCRIGVENCKDVGSGDRLIAFQELQATALVLCGKQEDALTLLNATLDFCAKLGVFYPKCVARMLIVLVQEFSVYRILGSKAEKEREGASSSLSDCDSQENICKVKHLSDALTALRIESSCFGVDGVTDDQALGVNRYFDGYLNLANAALLLLQQIHHLEQNSASTSQQRKTQKILLLRHCKKALDTSIRWNPKLIALESLEQGRHCRQELETHTEYKDQIYWADAALEALSYGLKIAVRNCSHEFELLAGISIEIVALFGKDLGILWSDWMLKVAFYWLRFTSRVLHTRRSLLVDASISDTLHEESTSEQNESRRMASKLKTDIKDLEIRCASSMKESCVDLKEISSSRKLSLRKTVIDHADAGKQTKPCIHHTMYHLFSLLREGRKQIIGKDLRVLEFSRQAQQYLTASVDPSNSLVTMVKDSFLSRTPPETETPSEDFCLSSPPSSSWFCAQWHAHQTEMHQGERSFTFIAMSASRAKSSEETNENEENSSAAGETNHYKFATRQVSWNLIQQTRRALQNFHRELKRQKSSDKEETQVAENDSDRGGEVIAYSDKYSQEYGDCLEMVSSIFDPERASIQLGDQLPTLSLSTLETLEKLVDVGFGVDMEMEGVMFNWLCNLLFR